MPEFSEQSRAKLLTCHPLLQKLFNAVVKEYDCTVLYGFRDEKDQNDAYKAGKSKLKFPLSTHNKTPSEGIDVAPFPIDWLEIKRFYHFAGFVTAKAKSLNIPIRWGGDWDGDFDLRDQNFFDLVHFELVLKKDN